MTHKKDTRQVYSPENPSESQAAYMSLVGCGWHCARRHELLRRRFHMIGAVESPDALVAELARHGVAVSREVVLADLKFMQRQHAEALVMAGVAEDADDVPTLPID